MIFRVEMNDGQPSREVQAHSFRTEGVWLIFFRRPSQGGSCVEYWRVQIQYVVSVETKP